MFGKFDAGECGRRCRREIMNGLNWILLATLLIGTSISADRSVAAESQTGVPSQSEIERVLKTRGLPTPGTVANPAVESRPGYVPANVPSGSVPGEMPQPGTAEPPSIAFKTITFEFGSAQLSAEATETLRNLGNALNQGLRDEKMFLIEGHTDRKGTLPYNLDLSQRRADAVKDYLVRELGVAADRLRTVGKGFSDLANPRNPYAPENRRVLVVNLGGSS
jgi:OOP family OmpA-OmpF porin